LNFKPVEKPEAHFLLPPSSSFVSGRFGSFFILNAPPGHRALAALLFGEQAPEMTPPRSS
jgi:hypothetical protein